jgi:hypothetical protein
VWGPTFPLSLSWPLANDSVMTTPFAAGSLRLVTLRSLHSLAYALILAYQAGAWGLGILIPNI